MENKTTLRTECFKCKGAAEPFDLLASLAPDAPHRDQVVEALEHGTPYRCTVCRAAWMVLDGAPEGIDKKQFAANLAASAHKPRGWAPPPTPQGDPPPWAGASSAPWGPNRHERRRQTALGRRGRA